MLEVRDVAVAFGDEPVLDGVDLVVGEGEVVGLLGPSGSGKSTLLRVIAGLVVPDRGTVAIDGVDVTRVPTHRRSVGMVFQDEQLFPHLTVADNVGFGLAMAGVDRARRARRVDDLLDTTGLTGLADRDVAGLSGGEAKRVALARSLAPEPRVLLLDEPLTGLDRDLHDRLAVEVSAILRRAGTTAVWVTHDRDEALAVAGRVVLLGSGRLSSGGASGPVVVELAGEETHDLRRAVLRGGAPDADVAFDGDREPATVHLGVRVGGELVAISTWLPRPFPPRPDRRAYQLRGMATDPAHRGTGIGALLLAEGIARCRQQDAELVWARARDTALDFYRRHGFTVEGDGFLDPTTHLPHHHVLLPLPPVCV